MRQQMTDFNFSAHETNENVSSPKSGIMLLKDIKERVSSNSEPPSPPTCKTSATGFPTHVSRRGISKFKRNRIVESPNHDAPNTSLSKDRLIPQPTGLYPHKLLDSQLAPSQVSNFDPSIDQENKQRLARMSEDEIQAAKVELMSGLGPSLIEKLLKKANIDEGRSDLRGDPQSADIESMVQKSPLVRRVTFEDRESSWPAVSAVQRPLQRPNPDRAPLSPPPDLQPTSSGVIPPLPPGIHFPRAPAPLLLDPSDPEFLSNLHSTYFPSLPADPSTLAWMAPIKKEEQDVYSSSQSAIPPSALRFDFRGRLLPPRLSSQISPAKGLHHHAHAPESAGYTIPELAHLARSAVPSQRCIAYQTIGRLLYRLGRGDFGPEGEDLCEGLWELVAQGKILEGMVSSAERESKGNRSVWATATEACWLWKKGGGRRWKGR